MDIGESLFRSWLRYKEKRRSHSSERDPVRLKEERGWLTALGVLLLGDLPDIRGGTLTDPAASFLLFPDELSLLTTEDEDRRLLLYRLLYLVESKRSGIVLPEAVGGDRLGQLVFAILTQPLVCDALETRYPAVAKMTEETHRLVLLSRRVLETIREPADCIELAVRQRLGATDSVTFRSEKLRMLASRLTTRLSLPEAHAAFSDLMADSSLKAATQPVPIWGVLTPERNEAAGSISPPGEKRRRSLQHEIDLGRTVRLKQQKPTKKPANPLFHSFEKTESLEDYQGEGGAADSESDLDEDEEGLRDLGLGHVVRTFDETPGLLRADIADDPQGFHVATPDDASDAEYKYPEWDFRSHGYLEDWCRLFEHSHSVAPSIPEKVRTKLRDLQPEISKVRRAVYRLLSERVHYNRQLDGPEIDVDAMVDRHADLRARSTPPMRLYLADRRHLKDVAMILLLDTSLSTDGWVEGRRVLDVELEASFILAEAFRGLFDEEICVAHFNSSTRHDCRYMILKSFKEPWSAALARGGSVEPSGYTRIGPALRHSTRLLSEAQARKKFLLIVSDGKPTDYDRYEGRYGVRDVAQAVREAKQLGITTFGLAVEHQPKHYLAEMFGAGRFHILPNSSLLPEYMVNIFLEALRG